MINKENLKLGTERSAIRELFEYGKLQAEALGDDKVFDFSLGNPSTPAPKEVDEAIIDIIKNDSSVLVHGYTSAQGALSARKAIAASISKQSSVNVNPDEIYITCGAAASLCAVFGALSKNDDTEFIAIAPYFPEYKVFVNGRGAKLKVVPAKTDDFQIDFDCLSNLIGKNTAGIIINSPNNPSGRVYTRETLERLAEILEAKANEFGHPIYIISDEPYRELVYNNIEVPFIPEIYKNTIVCYSYSKTLSLPGERIGYVYVPSFAMNSAGLYAAVAGAARSMGYVCAPSLFQRVIEKCSNTRPNLEDYRHNRDLLYHSLTSFGYECASPDGAFYLFVKAPNGDGDRFSEMAKNKNVLIVPGASFGCKEFVRISYCVDTKKVECALPLFKELIEEC
ncbi:MAG: pyridoxal phosphate-dependent aminotransferase [Clostridia bacterium]|nr:pyridoxal phosphate-dependent aminotransferase [Clostridia bacterium]